MNLNRGASTIGGAFLMEGSSSQTRLVSIKIRMVVIFGKIYYN